MVIIKGGTIVGAKESFVGDIVIDGEKIVEVRKDPSTGSGNVAGEATVIDASGKLVFPGFIDAHTHFDLHVAGTVTCDDFYSGTRAAVAGGTTTIIDFGTQYKGETLSEGLLNWKKKAEEGVSCDFGVHMTISDWNEKTREECLTMMEEGVPTFKIYMTYDIGIDDSTVMRVLERLKEVGGIAGCHCENTGLIDALRDEYSSDERVGEVRSHYLTRPAEAEAEAINRYMYMAKVTGAPVIDVHLTCAAGLEEIRLARKRGVKAYAETCPQYLVLDNSAYENEDFDKAAGYVCAPPIRTKADSDALWEGISSGDIQTVCTDHCSFTKEQKRLGKDDFRKIPGGLPGVETRAILMYSEGVEKGRITKETLTAVCAENVARLYGLYPQKGVIAKGSDADIFILDPSRTKTITAAGQEGKCDYSPYEGLEAKGVIEKVFLRGALVAEEGKVIKENTGRFLKRDKPELFDV